MWKTHITHDDTDFLNVWRSGLSKDKSGFCFVFELAIITISPAFTECIGFDILKIVLIVILKTNSKSHDQTEAPEHFVSCYAIFF